MPLRSYLAYKTLCALKVGEDFFRRLNPELGFDPLRDIRRFLPPGSRPVVLDIGANTGQSVENFHRYLGDPVMHSFEPSPATFATLEIKARSFPNVRLNQTAVGEKRGTLTLIENTESDLSSVLEPGVDAYGMIARRTEVPVETVDDYCRDQGITSVAVLKTDTQGFDHQVLLGSEQMLRGHQIDLVFMEMIVSEMYQRISRFDETLKLMLDHGYCVVSFYQQHYRRQRLSWTDVLFASPKILK